MRQLLSMMKRGTLGADDPAHYRTKEVIEEADEQRDGEGDENNNERMRERLPAGWPDDVGELFSDVPQVGGECGHGESVGLLKRFPK